MAVQETQGSVICLGFAGPKLWIFFSAGIAVITIEAS